MSYQNILLIDDDVDDQEIFLAALNYVSETVACHTLSDARVALVQLSDKHVTPDLIFLDLNMPVMNGHQFLSELKKQDKLNHIPVIVFSTSSQPKTIQMSKDLGARDFITKPSNFDELVSILKSVIN